METPTNTKADNLEVTGVSRSGRVRKKSSKLLDFQSPDDIDSRSKRVSTPKLTNIKPLQIPPLSSTANYGQQLNSPPLAMKIDTADNLPPVAIKHELNLDLHDDMGGDMDEMDTMDSDDNDGNTLQIDTTVRKSAYMTEKSTKKKVFKDGRLVVSKTQRKDKGKSRFTAYMLWAKDVRQEMLFTYPDMDFSTISRRLGELWANVPSNEKYNWRRRAKRIAAKSKEKGKDSSGPSASTANKAVASSKFLNRNAPASPRTKKISQSERVATTQDTQMNVMLHQNLTTKVSPTSNMFKVSGTSPADVAAHLKLLGDSLTIIGERLKEHEGQITVSGSLSVLLDSLLCSVAPLMCLCLHIPELEDKVPDLKDTMSNTLDNIAYVMPGL